MRLTILSILLLVSQLTLAQETKLIIHTDQSEVKINKHIYGHFSEHLGRCIYGGIWVGPDSDIPNIDGYRKDVVEALKNLHIPNLRWPGGCFADEYHWMDGIGPRADRPRMVNTNWGGIVEDNSFGTHEFLNFCELIGTEPYLSLNVGSGTVEEMAKWVEYVNSDGDSPMANLRRKNGREEPWNVKFIGVGNESWGCGGSMRPEFYADQYRRYSTYCRNYGDNKLFKIASGASDYDFNWTKVMMENIGSRRMNGLSLHYYTVKGWQGSKGSATVFDRDEYAFIINKSLGIEPVLDKHIDLMNYYDPENRVSLMVDEWGTWFDVEPGTNPGFLYQQNTLRDAFVAGISLNIFNNRADRIKMANIAQVVNVLQSIILTKDEKMVLTPTYYVFDMYKVHQDAALLPSDIQDNPEYKEGDQSIPALNVSSSKSEDGTINISIVNVHPDKDITIQCDLRGSNAKSVTGQIVTAATLDAYNDFDKDEKVTLKEFNKAKIKNNFISVTIPAKSVVMLRAK